MLRNHLITVDGNTFVVSRGEYLATYGVYALYGAGFIGAALYAASAFIAGAASSTSVGLMLSVVTPMCLLRPIADALHARIIRSNTLIRTCIMSSVIVMMLCSAGLVARMALVGFWTRNTVWIFAMLCYTVAEFSHPLMGVLRFRTSSISDALRTPLIMLVLYFLLRNKVFYLLFSLL